jgi:hypothetical protein
MSTEGGGARVRQVSVLDDQVDEEIKFLWVRDDKDVWRLADVDKVNADGSVVVKELYAGGPTNFKLADCHPFDPSHDIDMDDISRMVRYWELQKSRQKDGQ